VVGPVSGYVLSMHDISEKQRQAERMATLYRVAETVSHALDLTETLQSVCVEMARIFDVRNVGIGLLDPAQTAIEIVAFYSTDPSEENATGPSLPLEGHTAIQEVIVTQKTGSD
jgi:GAF domain-containing protein